MELLLSGELNWRNLARPTLGFMNTFSETLVSVEHQFPGIIPDLRNAPTLFIGSDYSGQHGLATHEALAFILAGLEDCGRWEASRRLVRKRFLRDARRMSFKNLSDHLRRKALVPFLRAANDVPGVVFVVLIDKNVQNLFAPHGGLDVSSPELQQYRHWRPAVLERLLRIIHFVGFFLAGLSRENQDVLWFTDQDDIAPNEKRLCEMVDMAGIVMSHYLPHTLRNLRIGTAASDPGDRSIEDLLSIPDLVAGAACELLAEWTKVGYPLVPNLTLPAPKEVRPRSRSVLTWFADYSQPLKRLFFVIDESPVSSKLRLTHIYFQRPPTLDLR